MTLHPLHLFLLGSVVALSLSALAADPPSAKGGLGVTLDDIIKQLDTNNDGKISKDEATGTFAQRGA